MYQKSLFFILAFTIISFACALSPPWNIFEMQIKSTLGADPCVHVYALQQQDPTIYILPIHTCKSDLNKPIALSVFLQDKYSFGNINILVYVNGAPPSSLFPNKSNFNTSSACLLIEYALRGNPYFIQTLPKSTLFDYSIEFTNNIVQYFDDNLNDYFGNQNQLASVLFDQVLQLSQFSDIVKIGVTINKTQ